ncbi:hypothetical protein [Kushneria indalinina]|uniref:Lipoprotein n=1 Tax=Kushneria indalinina DSM 14324 TaxID=1122140 RepID=A0A3D9DRM1_9GAMM|nr:hypothetical protein [Kushneria indalinina]REC93326.1 hypothetical protein C8D72_3485 [Kushneria indalinina DSM 14324]
MNIKTIFATAAISFAIAGCGNDDGESFVGTWKGYSDSKDADFTYQIEKERSTFNVHRQMLSYEPDFYKATAIDKNTLKLEDGDVLSYNEENDTVFARADDVTLDRTQQ